MTLLKATDIQAYRLPIITTSRNIDFFSESFPDPFTATLLAVVVSLDVVFVVVIGVIGFAETDVFGDFTGKA